MPKVQPTRCPHCGGNQVFPDYNNDSSCLQCGEVIYGNRTIRRSQIEEWRGIIHKKRGRPRKVRPEEL